MTHKRGTGWDRSGLSCPESIAYLWGYPNTKGPKEIEFPNHGIKFVELLDILVGSLTESEFREFAEGLLCNLKGVDSGLEVCE